MISMKYIKIYLYAVLSTALISACGGKKKQTDQSVTKKVMP